MTELLAWLNLHFGHFAYETLMFRDDGTWPYVRWGDKDGQRRHLHPFTALTFPG